MTNSKSSEKSSLYSSIRESVLSGGGEESRVEVNQRALIDKILARYASQNAVYRELLQNSNDADAQQAEIHFETEQQVVTQVVYKNNGMPFRPQDWSRLKKIAEGNPDVSKIGAFGVGAYTIFSICEEPIVLSGKQALIFFWKGDALWTRTVDNPGRLDTTWTEFVMPSRDPYLLPSMVEFGEFLCASLTFTRSLRNIQVFVDNDLVLEIDKSLLQPPTPISIPKSSNQSSSLWRMIGSNNQDEIVTQTPRGIFRLENSTQQQHPDILESIYQLQVSLRDRKTNTTILKATTQARYVSAQARTKLSSDMIRKMERVTKKQPPKQVEVAIFLRHDDETNATERRPTNDAERITQSFAPQQGAGKIFIGFRTSQTTGLAVHVSAPFVPTVEREAMDLQDPTLKLFNVELLEVTGILLRLVLEHAFIVLDSKWQQNKEEREKLELDYRKKLDQEIAPMDDNDVDDNASSVSSKSTSGGIMSFAKFMARGVKKTIVSAVKSVVDGDELLYPPDPRPLSTEERQAILLKQSFCPRQSTPDTTVGFALAQGFSRCIQNANPPVLTISGVVRGDHALLPHYGIEGFVKEKVVRSIVHRNAEEYFTYVARSRRLVFTDVIEFLKLNTLEEREAVRLLKWWVKYSRIETHGTVQKGNALKETMKIKMEEKQVTLGEYIFFVDTSSILHSENTPDSTFPIPLPETVLPLLLQKKIGNDILSDPALATWFEPLPVEVWADFISQHRCLRKGLKDDADLRITCLSILNREFNKRNHTESAVFGDYCRSILRDVPCIPFDAAAGNGSDGNTSIPGDLYVYSAELKAFEGIEGSIFRRVSKTLETAGVSENFLLALGVRKSVSIDFLFENLDNLRWSQDPRALVEYLRTATLSNQDMLKLRNGKYLPAEGSKSSFKPSELYLPMLDLRIFPFVNMLHWPSESEVSAKSANGRFLTSLGMQSIPPFSIVLSHLSNKELSRSDRIKCIDFLADRMGPHGEYNKSFTQMSFHEKKKYRILPCIVRFTLEKSEAEEVLCSPVDCYGEDRCSVMGFPVVDPNFSEMGKLYSNLFQCSPEPSPVVLLSQLQYLVETAKRIQNNTVTGDSEISNTRIESTFGATFKYLSHRCSDFSVSQLESLNDVMFIPVLQKGSFRWCSPGQVFFHSDDSSDDLTTNLFTTVEFSPFLAATGVRQEATTKDIFKLLMKDPKSVYDIIGSEEKYRILLRRIAANPPFRTVTNAIRKLPFLLAYKYQYSGKEGSRETAESGTFLLASADDIFIIDNSFFGRMFAVNRAPPETDLEDFYASLGSQYISKAVSKRFEVIGKPNESTGLTHAIRDRISERAPLLVSPNVTSRPLVTSAASILSRENLAIFQATSLMAVYSLGKITRRAPTTCFSRSHGTFGSGKNALFIVEEFDWFDIGYAIGDLIFQRCQLEDAFFISSLLEAPLDQLRARGFPVDRILKLDQHIDVAPDDSMTSEKEKRQSGPTSGTARVASENRPHASSDHQSPTERDQKLDTSTNSTDDTSIARIDETGSQGLDQILQQMFPDADTDYIQNMLGPQPSLERVRELAEEMAMGKYPRSNQKANGSFSTSEPSPVSKASQTKKNRGLRGKIGKAFSGLRGSNFGGAHQPPPGSTPSSFPPPSTMARPGGGTMEERQGPVSPAEDANSQQNLNKMLENRVKTTRPVDSSGTSSTPTNLTSIPEGLDRGETCEVIPGQNLTKHSGPRGDGFTFNGIRVFAQRDAPQSVSFLQDNIESVEAFSLVLERLATVYGIPLSSMAIFHNPSGGTIAFNSGGALHFNIRFFHALHFLADEHEKASCYSYWFMTLAHELAHQLVSAHNKEHGFYTEGYATHYLPKLVELLKTL